MGTQSRRADFWKIAVLDALALGTLALMYASDEALDLFHVVFWATIAQAFFIKSWGFWVRLALALAAVEALLIRAGNPAWQDLAEPFVLASIATMVFVMHKGRDRARAALRDQATHDPLTGLLNRRALQMHLDEAVGQMHRDESSFAVIYVDLDGFKGVNDKFGHDVGDIVLTDAARRIEKATRKTDVTGRIGGDEFAVLLSTPTTRAEAETTARRLSEELRQPFPIAEGRVELSASMGVAMATTARASTPQQLLAEADRAMYHVKRTERGTYAFAGDATAP